MSTVLGGVTLDHDLDWADEFDQPVSAGAADRTIFGTMVVQSFPISGGRLMTLQGDQSHGWQKRSTIMALELLVRTLPEAVHTITINGVSYSVMFRNEDQPAISFQKVTFATEPGADFWYYGTIKLRIM